MTVLGSFTKGGEGACGVWCGYFVDARAEKTGIVGTVAGYGTDGVLTASLRQKGPLEF